MNNNTKKRSEGSALLVALVIMAVLLTLSLGVSELLISALRDSRNLIETTKAWYAAEAGIEHALLSVSDNTPGFEEQKEVNLDENIKGTFSLHATAKEIPVKEAYEIESAKDLYADLHLNESITIPLFRGPKPEDKVQNFRVDYYLAPDIQLRGGHIDNDLDILRWKIFGIASDGAMEVINEFVPANQGNSAESPTCIGTSAKCYNAAKFYKRVLSSDGTTEFDLVERFPIATFLQEHTQNFLVLTNVANVDVIAGVLSLEEKKKIANIRYHIIEEDGQARLTLPTIQITASGEVNGTRQSIATSLRRETFLPVFNYALYRTVEE